MSILLIRIILKFLLVSGITSVSSAVSSLSIFLHLIFGWSQICDDPWLLGHVDKWRASLSSTSACHGCVAWMFWPQVSVRVDGHAVGQASLKGVWAEGRKKHWDPLSCLSSGSKDGAVKGSSIFHSWMELPSLCLSQRSGLFLDPVFPVEDFVRQTMNSLEKSYQSLSREHRGEREGTAHLSHSKQSPSIESNLHPTSALIVD